MTEFKPRFKEGSLVDIRLKGIVVDVMPGRDEEDTWYDVLIGNTRVVRQFASCDVSERSE